MGFLTLTHVTLMAGIIAVIMNNIIMLHPSLELRIRVKYQGDL